MSEEVEVTTEDNSYSLEQLTEWVRTQEAAWGPILRIGNVDETTAGAFDWDNPDNPKPDVEAEIVEADADADEHEGELCRGEVYIETELKNVIVFRPEA